MKGKKINRTSKVFLLTLAFLVSATCAESQVASNPPYTLDQSVIAGGGGTSSSAGNTYSITGAIGQSVTDASSNSPYSIKSGFFTAAAPLAPTAAMVSVSGRVLTNEGRGIRNVILILTDSNGYFKTATTTAFGYYSFADVVAGETYIITARGKRFIFSQQSQVVNVTDDATDINFIGNSVPNLRDY